HVLRHRASKGAPQRVAQMLGGNAAERALDFDHAAVEPGAGRKIEGCDQALADQGQVRRLAIGRTLDAVSERRIRKAHAVDECLELLWLDRSEMIRTRQSAVEREMLLDGAGAERGGGDGAADSFGMVGK